MSAALPNSLISAADTAWNAYASHVRKYFYAPDLDAVEIVLSSCCSHFHKGTDPVWLFVLGPSGGDKTSVVINSILDLPTVEPMGDLTSKTFLSAYGQHSSLLHRLGSGILAFKDFTTYANKRVEEQAEISCQLREIADGYYKRDTGKGEPLNWKGKITVIAAATPAIEREWGKHKALGERFLQIRIARKNGIEQSLACQRQRGLEEFISIRMKELAKEFFINTPKISYPPPQLNEEQSLQVANMSEFVSYARANVPRHPITNEINGTIDVENNGRVSKPLSALIAGHAALFRHTAINERDMALGRRVALQTIPVNRLIILSAIPLDGFIYTEELQAKVGLVPSTLKHTLADLEALGVIKIGHNTVVANSIEVSPQLAACYRDGFHFGQQPQARRLATVPARQAEPPLEQPARQG